MIYYQVTNLVLMIPFSFKSDILSVDNRCIFLQHALNNIIAFLMLRAVATLLLTVNLMTEVANAKECVLRTIINKS